MSQNNSERLHCRVTLPDGRLADAVVNERDWESSAHPVRRLQFDASKLLLCPQCWQSTVCVHDAMRTGISFKAELLCGNCRWSATCVIEERLMDFLDEEEARQRHRLALDRVEFDLSVMEDEVDRFVSALEADHIVPEDF